MPSHFRLAAAVVALLSVISFAQESSSPASAEQAAKEQKGLAALHEAIAQSQNLNLTVNKIYVESSAAVLLWTRDEALARSLVSNVRAHFKELASQTGTDRSRDLLAQQAFNFRRDLATTMARTDPQFALDFIHATAPPPQLNFAGNWEADLELSVAAAAAQSNPKLAASVVRQNMNTTNSYAVAGALEQIWNKDSSTATQLAGELMNRLTNANFAADQQALMTATQVLQSYGSRVHMVQAAARNPKAPTPPPAILSDAQVQALAQAVYSAAQKPDFPASWMHMVQNIMPQIQAFVPGASPLRGAPQQLSPNFWNDINTAVQKGNIDQALALAAAAPPDYRMNAIQNVASSVASSTGNLDAAREILNRSEMPEAQRQQWMEQLTSQAAIGIANRGSLAQARATADLIRYNTERAQAYVQLAQAAISKKDNTTAATLLNDARSMLSSPPADVQELGMLGQIASMYVQIDPGRSLEMLSGVIDLVNEKMPALAAADGFAYGGTHNFYGGEMVMQNAGGSNPLLMQLQHPLSQLAGVNPGAALDLAAKLQRPEAKVMAYIGIARTLLGGGNVGYGWGGGVGYGRGGVTFITH